MITIRKAIGSGRGKCWQCGKIIGKGVPQVVAEGYRDSSRMHLSCLLIEDVQNAIQDHTFPIEWT